MQEYGKLLIVLSLNFAETNPQSNPEIVNQLHETVEEKSFPQSPEVDTDLAALLSYLVPFSDNTSPFKLQYYISSQIVKQKTA